ncbi:hypothetical protein [Streptomyces celluloflavus]|uniref:hypothetical protein n=1 Tax=Streptomyces celluloflavus TaxID=58344 RepID=UPI003699C824
MGRKSKRGVRIPWVRDARDNDYDRTAIDHKPHPPYVLPLKCGGCGVEVSVRTANAGDPDSRSSHFFTMPGRKHKPTCTFDLPRRGGELVDASQGTVVRQDGRWRLKCPPLERTGSRGDAKDSGSPARPPQGGGQGEPSVSALRGPAIASAARIVRLLKNFQHDPEVLAEFAAVVPGGGQDIAWDEFCFGSADAGRLAQPLIDGTARQIPHAVWGPVSIAGQAGRHGTYQLQYVARHPVLIEGRHVKVRVVVRCGRSEWIDAGTRSGSFLGYGYWQLFPKDWAQTPHERDWIELQLWIKEPWQVARWGTEDAPAPVADVIRPTPQPDPRTAHQPTPAVPSRPTRGPEGSSASPGHSEPSARRSDAPAPPARADESTPDAEPAVVRHEAETEPAATRYEAETDPVVTRHPAETEPAAREQARDIGDGEQPPPQAVQRDAPAVPPAPPPPEAGTAAPHRANGPQPPPSPRYPPTPIPPRSPFSSPPGTRIRAWLKRLRRR